MQDAGCRNPGAEIRVRGPNSRTVTRDPWYCIWICICIWNCVWICRDDSDCDSGRASVSFGCRH